MAESDEKVSSWRMALLIGSSIAIPVIVLADLSALLLVPCVVLISYLLYTGLSPQIGEIEPARKRGLFHLHLATLVFLMFIAGGLIWANLRLSRADRHENGPKGPFPSATRTIRNSVTYGFPVGFYEMGTETKLICTANGEMKPESEQRLASVHWGAFAGNVLLNLLVLFLAGLLAEYVVRHPDA